MSTPSPALLDDTDEQVLVLLERDGRLTHQEVADRTGLSRSAAAARVQRLIGEGHVEVRGVVHPAVLGHRALAHVSVSVRGAAAPVAAALADRSDTTLVSLTAGRRPVVAELRAGEVADIEGAVAEIRELPGVEAAETVLYTDVLRDVAGPTGSIGELALDEADHALLRAVQADGRASYVRLAAEIGLSAASARRRLVRLRAANVVRVGAIPRHSGSERRTATGVGLRLSARVGAPLAELSSVTFEARTLGRFDALLTVNTTTTADLVTVLDELRGRPEVREVETWTHLRFAKETYASLRL
ncbi:Lrp/AsnC family transcriptional regulator [Saccharopolyspora griseoalba]|uniref:Lrp/AsnC family transcriptional regulator n=1 Tax=Saccharopolyspora griseoalba TaxID=1431848 RepID=A0ABW2LUC9_9PSEU